MLSASTTFNDFGSILAHVNENTIAIIMETVQGEGGLYPADKDFIKKVRELCDEEGILLILDEVQCGMGRTGSMYAFFDYDIKPDILTTAKALGNGLPIGAFAVTNEVAGNSLVPGDHGTTYGGNPLCTAAVSQVFDMFKEYDLVKHVNEVSPYLEEILDRFVEKYDFVVGRRGKGLMQGLVLTIPVKEVVKKALLEEHLVVLSAGADVLRLLPPLVITEQEVDIFREKLQKVFDTFM